MFLHAAVKNAKFSDLIEKIGECQHMIDAAEVEIANGPPRDIEEKDLQWHESKAGESDSVLKADKSGTERDVALPGSSASNKNPPTKSDRDARGIFRTSIVAGAVVLI